jgi:hypothetical protein
MTLDAVQALYYFSTWIRVGGGGGGGYFCKFSVFRQELGYPLVQRQEEIQIFYSSVKGSRFKIN